MPRHPRPAPGERTADPAPPPTDPGPDLVPTEGGTPEPRGSSRSAPPSLAGLGIAGVSRRRLAWLGLAVLAAWVVIGFAGQAADGARAATRLASEQATNTEVAAQTASMRRELELVTQERWVLQQARAYRLGSRKERPFALAPGAPALPSDAPGSAARRLGAAVVERSPLESWLDVLFGPSGG